MKTITLHLDDATTRRWRSIVVAHETSGRLTDLSRAACKILNAIDAGESEIRLESPSGHLVSGKSATPHR